MTLKSKIDRLGVLLYNNIRRGSNPKKKRGS